MTVRFDWWVLLALLVYAIAILAGGTALESAKRKVTSRVGRVCLFLAIFLLTAGGLNTATYHASATLAEPPLITGADVANYGFGLKSGEKYPLVIGGRLGGATVSGSSFSARVSPGSTLSVDFTGSNEVNYVLEIPVKEIDFITDEDPAKASVILKLEGWSGRTYGPKQLVHSGPCKSIIQSGYLACDRTLEWKTVISQEVISGGLPNIVSANFSHAIITLPCDEYREVLGARARSRNCG